MSYASAVQKQPSPTINTGRSDDIHLSSYAVWLNRVFYTKPQKYDEAYIYLQTMYQQDPTQFVITHSLHQNGLNDVLHFGVEMRAKYLTIKLHINGYWIANDFKVVNATYNRNYDKTWSQIITLCDFTTQGDSGSVKSDE